MTKPREKTREEVTAGIEGGEKSAHLPNRRERHNIRGDFLCPFAREGPFPYLPIRFSGGSSPMRTLENLKWKLCIPWRV